jgi:hypothetical protein
MVAPNTYYAIQGKDADFEDVTVDSITVSGAIVATGGVTGDVTGNVTGGLNEAVTLVSADGAIAIPTVNTTYFITKAGVAAMTLAAPAAGDNGVRLTFISATANAHTLDMASTGLNEGSADIGTFGGAKGDGCTLIAYNQHWYLVPGSNTNVTFA